MSFTIKIQKKFCDSGKKDKAIAKMSPGDKEPKHSTIHSFLNSPLEKKKVNISTSTTNESSQITESDGTTCHSTDKSPESLSSSSPLFS